MFVHSICSIFTYIQITIMWVYAIRRYYSIEPLLILIFFPQPIFRPRFFKVAHVISTYAEFSKHVCLQWLNPLGYYRTKSPPDPPKNRPLKALFMSGLWGESNRPKDSVDCGFSTCYHWGHIPKDPIGQGLNKFPFHGWLIATNGWVVRRRRRRESRALSDEGWDRWPPRS